MKQLSNALRTLAFLAALQLAASEASALTYLRSRTLTTSTSLSSTSLSTSYTPTVTSFATPEGDRDERLEGQTRTKGAAVGNGTLGAGVSFTAQMRKGSHTSVIRDSAKARARVRAHIDLFGRRADLIDLQVHASRDHYMDKVGGMEIRENKLYLRYLDETLWDKLSADTVSKSKSWNFTLFSQRYPVPVGPVVFSLKVRAGVGLSIGLSARQTSPGVKVSGQAGAWAYGSITFSLDLIVAEAGVKATLKFFHTYLNAAMQPELKQLDGAVTLFTLPFSVHVKAFVKVGYSYVSKEWSLTLVNSSSKSIICVILEI